MAKITQGSEGPSQLTKQDPACREEPALARRELRLVVLVHFFSDICVMALLRWAQKACKTCKSAADDELAQPGDGCPNAPCYLDTTSDSELSQSLSCDDKSETECKVVKKLRKSAWRLSPTSVSYVIDPLGGPTCCCCADAADTDLKVCGCTLASKDKWKLRRSYWGGIVPRNCACFHCRGQWAPGAYSVTGSGANPVLEVPETCLCKDLTTSKSCPCNNEEQFKSPGCEKKDGTPDATSSSSDKAANGADLLEKTLAAEPNACGCCTCTTCCRWGGDYNKIVGRFAKQLFGSAGPWGNLSSWCCTPSQCTVTDAAFCYETSDPCTTTCKQRSCAKTYGTGICCEGVTTPTTTTVCFLFKPRRVTCATCDCVRDEEKFVARVFHPRECLGPN